MQSQPTHHAPPQPFHGVLRETQGTQMLLRINGGSKIKVEQGRVCARTGNRYRRAARRGGLAEQIQALPTIRKSLFPTEFFKGVLDLRGAHSVNEVHRRADIPYGATVRGAGNANVPSRAL